MSERCLEPRQLGDTRYCFGVCTWHGPIAETATRADGVPCCPNPLCTGDLFEVPSEAAFWNLVERGERLRPGYAEMMRWAKGKCFPDGETLENAFRQDQEAA